MTRRPSRANPQSREYSLLRVKLPGDTAAGTTTAPAAVVVDTAAVVAEHSSSTAAAVALLPYPLSTDFLISPSYAKTLPRLLVAAQTTTFIRLRKNFIGSSLSDLI